MFVHCAVFANCLIDPCLLPCCEGALILTVKGPAARVSFWEHPSGLLRTSTCAALPVYVPPLIAGAPVQRTRQPGSHGSVSVSRAARVGGTSAQSVHHTTGRASLRSPCSRGSSGKIALPLTYICQGRRTPFLALFSKYKVIGPFGCALIFGFPSGIIR